MVDDILTFVRTNFKASVGRREIDLHTPLFSSGLVDSFGVLEVIAFLEDRFGIEIDPARHNLLEFDTATSIVGVVDRLRARAHGG